MTTDPNESDTDGDGLYEDVDGNGRLTWRDNRDLARIVFNYRIGRLTFTEPLVEALDFRDDGRLDGRDVRKHRELSSGVAGSAALTSAPRG